MDRHHISGLPVVDAARAPGRRRQPDGPRPRARDGVPLGELAGAGRAPPDDAARRSPSAARRRWRSRRPRDGARHIHRLVVVDDDDETLPIGVLSTTDLVHAIARQAATPACTRPPTRRLRCPTAPRSSRSPASPRRLHEARLGAALPVLRHPRLRRGVRRDRSCRPTAAASPTWSCPADAGLAREHHPARHGRDPRLQPARAAHPASSCSTSASAAWPASAPAPTRAILASSCRSRSSRRASRPSPPRSPTRQRQRRRPRQHFAPTTKYGDVPARQRPRARRVRHLRRPGPLQGLRGMRRGLRGARPRRAGHDRQGRRRADRREHPRALRARHALLPHPCRRPPTIYRNEKALADLMLGEHALGYVGGAGSCAGCGEATAIRMLVAATRQVHGPESMGIVAATGCNTVFGSTYPFNPYLVPWTNSLFENAPAVALGIRARWDQAGHPDRRLWVMGGDGAMYDIGFQALSRMVASGADIKVLVLDTQVYSNTGGQASTASLRRPGHEAVGLRERRIHGRPEPRKELGRILMAHGDVVRRPDDAGPPQPLLPHDHGGQRLPGPGGRHRLHAVHARARHRRRRRRPGRPSWPSSRARSRCSPTTRAAARRSPSGCRSRATRPCARTGRALRTARPIDFLDLRPDRGPVRAALRTPTARRPTRSWRRRRTGWRTGGRSRSWPASRSRAGCMCLGAPGRGRRDRRRGGHRPDGRPTPAGHHVGHARPRGRRLGLRRRRHDHRPTRRQPRRRTSTTRPGRASRRENT